eukprot:CAMPEP_0171077190 /NCGR_PEP_ID=MMETSP0766_2-20121228/13878_1 /TAXON_ID=439317 /ORGANISM="Gambierdiscus australes, Strain CAWD 149" /LENGTH=76 /DNA_ID=CAMNT_0011534231 /DNA_START=54 /DNA_END=284 /DNA_ORIENTATION=+
MALTMFLSVPRARGFAAAIRGCSPWRLRGSTSQGADWRLLSGNSTTSFSKWLQANGRFAIMAVLFKSDMAPYSGSQ